MRLSENYEWVDTFLRQFSVIPSGLDENAPIPLPMLFEHTFQIRPRLESWLVGCAPAAPAQLGEKVT